VTDTKLGRFYDRPVAVLHLLRVFVNDNGEWGNRLGVFLDGDEVPREERQRVAAELGFSETTFLDGRTAGRLSIHTPQIELAFAGHPTVGVAWLLAHEGTPVEALHPPAGEVEVRHVGEATFVAARPAWAPPFEYEQFESPAVVRSLSAAGRGANTYAWSWIDEAAGTIRARAFAPEAGRAEDEATGSVALALCAQLDRPITVHQGHGSVLRCRPLADGRAEVGGRVALDEIRTTE
jgi:predicted PhzF superfamily epimerase YddE/YHI9